MPQNDPPARTRVPAKVVPAEAPSISSLLSLAIGVVVVCALYFGRDVILPITLAALLSFALAPLADFLRRVGLWRVPAAILAVLMALGLLLAVGFVIFTQIGALARDFPLYQATLEQKVGSLQEATLDRLSGVLDDFGRGLQRATERPEATDGSTGGAPGNAGPERDGLRPLPVEVRPPDATPLEIAQRVLVPALSPVATLLIVFVVAVFALLERQDLRDRMIRLFGSTDLHRTTMALDDAARRLSRYFLTQAALNTSYGLVTTAVLWMIGVPAAPLWGILAALMRYVPFVGTPIAALPPIILAAGVDPGWGMVLWTALYFVVGEGLMGQVVEPVAFGQSTGLSPFAVIIAAIFWTWLWGGVGLLLATPLTVCLAVLGRHVERLEFLGVLLADKPALTPAESFYQRMLAGDPDEALDHAERLLKERSLTAYYDEVALAGLQLAANDALRGVLDGPRLSGVRDAVRDLVEGLAEQADIQPEKPVVEDEAAEEVPDLPPIAAQAPAREALAPSWQGEAPVLCVAGRGPLDEAAATMLAQLLDKHGLGARVVPHEAVSRHGIEALDTAGAAMVCVSYLDIRGNPAHLRLLLRRLRSRLPEGARMLVGLWPQGEAVLTDTALRSQVGADHYVTTLREAVETCVTEARSASGEEEPRIAAQ